MNLNFNASVAEWFRQGTLTSCYAGSNPAGCTIFGYEYKHVGSRYIGE